MSERRHTDKPEIAPDEVIDLTPGHPAMRDSRTLFPSTVATVTRDFQERLLVSGHNNRKLGATVMKGAWKGYGLYGLSLEERATCPADCDVRAACYGNGMPFARRHKISDPDVFYDLLQLEILHLLETEPGLLIRLHVLGDFPSVDYVAFWKDILADTDRVACYGYTHRHDDDIAAAIAAVKDEYPSRFRIRWSSPQPKPDGAAVILSADNAPAGGIVCPAQTDATACCATCGLCWELPAQDKTIFFLKHGRRSKVVEAERVATKANVAIVNNVRRIVSLPMPHGLAPAADIGPPPRVRLAPVANLAVEPAYQRDLSNQSIRLIRKIVQTWNWRKFKPPICSEQDDGTLFVLDGQHTAIAAASHPDIKEIPVLLVAADKVEERADSFVSHNRNRLNVHPLQVFHAEVAAGDREAGAVLRMILEAGATVPKTPPLRDRARPGQLLAINRVRLHCKAGKIADVKRAISIAVQAQCAPISSLLVDGLVLLLSVEAFKGAAGLSDDILARAVASISNLDAQSAAHAASSGTGRRRAAAALIAQAALAPLRMAS